MSAGREASDGGDRPSTRLARRTNLRSRCTLKEDDVHEAHASKVNNVIVTFERYSTFYGITRAKEERKTFLKKPMWQSLRPNRA